MVRNEAKEVVGQTESISHVGHSLYSVSNGTHCSFLNKGRYKLKFVF